MINSTVEGGFVAIFKILKNFNFNIQESAYPSYLDTKSINYIHKVVDLEL